MSQQDNFALPSPFYSLFSQFSIDLFSMSKTTPLLWSGLFYLSISPSLSISLFQLEFFFSFRLFYFQDQKGCICTPLASLNSIPIANIFCIASFNLIPTSSYFQEIKKVILDDWIVIPLKMKIHCRNDMLYFRLLIIDFLLYFIFMLFVGLSFIGHFIFNCTECRTKGSPLWGHQSRLALKN